MSVFNHFRKMLCLFALYFLAGALLQYAALMLPVSLPAFAIAWFLLSTTVFMFNVDLQQAWAAFAGALCGLIMSAERVVMPAGWGLVEMGGLLLLLFAGAALSCRPDEKGQALRWFAALLFVIWILISPAAFRIQALALLAFAVFVQSQTAESLLRRKRLKARSVGR